MSTIVPDTTPRAMRIDGPLSARAVLDHFNDRGRQLLGADQEDAAGRIAQLLAHEADLSAEWGGLPGTDHPRHWQTDVGDEAAVRRYAEQVRCWVPRWPVPARVGSVPLSSSRR